MGQHVAILLVDTEVVFSEAPSYITDRKSSLHILFPEIVLICVVGTCIHFRIFGCSISPFIFLFAKELFSSFLMKSNLTSPSKFFFCLDYTRGADVFCVLLVHYNLFLFKATPSLRTNDASYSST